MDERDCKYSACSVTFKRFLDLVDAAGIKTHIMAGIIPLKAAGMAKYMNENVPGIDVPQDMTDRLAAAAAEGKEKGIKGLPMQLGIKMAAAVSYTHLVHEARAGRYGDPDQMDPGLFLSKQL